MTSPDLIMSQTTELAPENSLGLPEQIQSLADSLSVSVRTSLKQIDDINTQSSLLSLNAKIEAARAGVAGRSFAVVATEMGELSDTTKRVAVQLSSKLGGDISELQSISKRLSTDVRGTRLADLALTNIDLIDRNLYERSCDVRWWATDSSVVDVLSSPTPDRVAYACKRLGVILNAYTVYFDLVACSLSGEVIANGRPERYKSIGMNVAKQRWFKAALETRSGDEFGFEIVHASPLVNGEYILAYSCAVRQGGESTGAPIGVLGILFNWRGLAQTVVDRTPLTEEEKAHSRVAILSEEGMILADSQGLPLSGVLQFQDRDKVWDSPKIFEESEDEAGHRILVAHAKAPGFETYSTHWHSVILQQI
jgi:hypothetical protein